MKYINYIFIIIIGYFIIFRLVAPKLISTNNDVAVVVGAAIVLVALYYAVREIIEHTKEKNENEDSE